MNLREVQAACVEEGNREIEPIKDALLICEPAQLAEIERPNEPLKGVQAQIAATQRDLSDSESWPTPVAVAILFFSCVPWVWYFLLRRISELRDAIIGK
jgi:hypothetical protein